MLHHPSDDGKPMPFPSRGDAMRTSHNLQYASCCRLRFVAGLRSMDVVRPKDVPRGKIMYDKDYQQASAERAAIGISEVWRFPRASSLGSEALLAHDIEGAVPSSRAYTDCS